MADASGMTPNGGGTLQSSDHTLQLALNALDTQISDMNSYIQRVDSCAQGISASFQSASSAVFLRQMQDWETEAKTVIKAFQSLQQDLQGTGQALSGGDDSATRLAQGWSAGQDPTYTALSPRIPSIPASQ